MKKYAEILEAITAARAGMVDTAKSEKELSKKAMVIAYKSGTDAEFDAAKAAYKAAEEKFSDERKHNEDLEMAFEILKDNAAQAFFAESIGTICTIWNKYAGKPHGERPLKKLEKNCLRPWASGSGLVINTMMQISLAISISAVKPHFVTLNFVQSVPTGKRSLHWLTIKSSL